MNTKILAVVAVAIVVIAGIAVAVSMHQSSSRDPVVETGRLLVYGNANNDDYLDDRDLEMVQSIVNGETTWDSEEYPFADANCDGEITSDDVTLIRNIIDGNTCTLYYLEYYESNSSAVVSITYPMKTDSIGIYQYQTGFLVSMLGLWDNVDYADNTTLGYTTAFDTEGINSYGNYSGSMMRTTSGLETFNSSNVDVLILNGYWDDTVVKDGLAAMGSDTQVIKPYCQGTYAISSMLTFGFILGCYDSASEYIAFYDKVMDYLNECLSGLSEEDYVTYYVVNNPTDSGAIKIRSSGSNGTYPDLAWVEMIPGVNLMPNGDNDTYQATRTAEWFLQEENASDYIIISMSSLSAYDNNVETALNTFKEMFSQTQAYSDGNIIGLAYGYFNGLYSPSMLVLLASYLYPDLVDQDYGWELFYEFFEKYHQPGSEGAEVYAGVYRMSTE
ncbi:MAG: hypothetical protein Q4Q58_00800 [Thermoplasmata archaeon]|nr:hypothetical protein [Thermoplasmata archaeon]